MAKLSHGADTWRSEGLLGRYKSQLKSEEEPKYKSKKDTVKWCRGKVGVAHEWHRKQRARWDWDTEEEYVSSYVEIWCANCKKQAYKRFGNAVYKFPLHIAVTGKSLAYAVQVKVNGKAIPFPPEWFYEKAYYCSQCHKWHS